MSNKRDLDALSSNAAVSEENQSMIEDSEERKAGDSGATDTPLDSKRARTEESSASSSSAASSAAAVGSPPQTDAQIRAEFAQWFIDLEEDKIESWATFLEPHLIHHDLWLPSMYRVLTEYMHPLAHGVQYSRIVCMLVMVASERRGVLSRRQQSDLVDRFMEMDVGDLDLQEPWACASLLCPTARLRTMLPRLIPVLTAPSVSARVFTTILSSIHSILTEPETLALLAQSPIAAVCVRLLSHQDASLCLMVLTVIQCLIGSSTEDLPFLDRMVEADLCDVARLTSLLQRDDGVHGMVGFLIHQLQAEMDVEKLIIELIPALIPRLSCSNENACHTVTSILCNCVYDANTAEQRAAILNSNAIPHLIHTMRPERADLTLDEHLSQLFDLDRAFPAIRTALDWKECAAVDPSVLHPFVAQMVQMRLVPLMEDLIQVPLNPVDGDHAARMLTVALFLEDRVYDRLPVGLLSSQPHVGLSCQSSIQRRSCAAPRPHWFNERLKLLREQRAAEQAAEAADDAEDEDDADEEEEA